MTRRLAGCLAALVAACGGVSARPRTAPAAVAAAACPATAFDYGSGMVALLPSPAAARVLLQAHAYVWESEALRAQVALARQPYLPHVGLLYGVTDAAAGPAAAAVAAWRVGRPALCLVVERLFYWDDLAGGKTTLAAEVHDADGALTALHAQLAAACWAPPRAAYRAHVTLAYLPPGARLPAALAEAVRADLAALSLRPYEAVVTDRCGRITTEILLGRQRR